MAGSSTSRVTSNIRYFRSLFFPLPLVDFFSQISCRERWHVREGRNWNFFRRWRLFGLINQLSNLTISAFEHNTLSNHCFSSRILFFFFFQISRIYPPAKTPLRSPKFTNFDRSITRTRPESWPVNRTIKKHTDCDFSHGGDEKVGRCQRQVFVPPILIYLSIQVSINRTWGGGTRSLTFPLPSSSVGHTRWCHEKGSARYLENSFVTAR